MVFRQGQIAQHTLKSRTEFLADAVHQQHKPLSQRVPAIALIQVNAAPGLAVNLYMHNGRVFK
jgi:hypothetical protein